MTVEEEHYASEYGSCPTCGHPVHISDMGSESGIDCCFWCHEQVREINPNQE